MILGRAKIHHEKDEKAKKEKMDAQGFGDNHEYLRSKLKYDKNDVEGLLLGEFSLFLIKILQSKIQLKHLRWSN